MKKPRASKGGKNIVGEKIAVLRKAKKLSQRGLASAMQLAGLDVDKNVVTRIETGKRYVADFELKAFAGFFGVSYSDLLD